MAAAETSMDLSNVAARGRGSVDISDGYARLAERAVMPTAQRFRVWWRSGGGGRNISELSPAQAAPSRVGAGRVGYWRTKRTKDSRCA